VRSALVILASIIAPEPSLPSRKFAGSLRAPRDAWRPNF
jgi:hypothetical protein